jgi:phosphomannomutase
MAFAVSTESSSTQYPVYRFGTSGYRNNSDTGFNEDVVIHITNAIADTLIEEMNQQKQAKPVLVGGDTRAKTKMAIPIIIETFKARGLDVYEVQGDVPTPVLAYAAAYFNDVTGSTSGCAGAVLMTASHNPWDYGGYNFLTPDGAVAPGSFTQQIETNQANPKHLVLNREEMGLSGEPKVISIMPYESYKDHLIQTLKLDVDALQNADMFIGYDPLYATGRHYFPKLMEDFGIRAVQLVHAENAPPEGYTGEPEPSAENLEELSAIVKAYQAKNPESLCLGFSNDGDSDRFGVLDEQGRYIHPNVILKLVAYLMVHHRKNEVGTMARSQATTHALDAMAGQLGMIQTPVGYKYVAEVFIEQAEKSADQHVVLGGESSGGLSIYKHIPEKDGLLANLLIAELVAKEGKPLSQIIEAVEASIPNRYVFAEWALKTELKSSILEKAHTLLEEGGSMGGDIHVDVAMSQASRHAMKHHFGVEDGIKLYLNNGSWVLLRASGTEPLVRLYIEAVGDSETTAHQILERLATFWCDYFTRLGISETSLKRKA